LRSFVSARCATSDEGPKALFDHATTWLSTLARLVASVRAEASEHLCFQIVEGIEVGLHGRLNGLLEVRAGSRFSDLERLRTSPAKVTGLELERALRRVGDVRQLGVGDLDLSALPGNRVLALARYGMTSPLLASSMRTPLRSPGSATRLIRPRCSSRSSRLVMPVEDSMSSLCNRVRESRWGASVARSAVDHAHVPVQATGTEGLVLPATYALARSCRSGLPPAKPRGRTPG
jgi:hypothetical protein